MTEHDSGRTDSVAEISRSTSASLNSALSTPWTFFHPTTELQASITGLAKHFLDPLALSISKNHEFQQTRTKKRKRSKADSGFEDHSLQLQQLYVEGFSPEQIWEQALRILDSADRWLESDYVENTRHAQLPGIGKAELDYATVDSNNSEDSELASLPDSHSDDSATSDEEPAEDSYSEITDASDDDNLDRHEGFDEPSDEDAASNESSKRGNDFHTYTEDAFGLNDGFFSIDDFNRQTDVLERQDIKGGPADMESDEEDINWDADPSTEGSGLAPRRRAMPEKMTMDEDVMDDSEEEGPTFDSANIEDDSDSSEVDLHNNSLEETGWTNTSDIKYADFFAPPPRKVSVKDSRPLPKSQPSTTIDDNDIDRAIGDVRRDLLEEDDEDSGEDSGTPNDGVDGPQTQRSSHEKQRARIADEIRRLETANVAKKEWMLSGEARAVERPINSLIEEDLEFEKIGKPVPVITAEISGDIEELIKRRIVAKEFDEVIRRRPGVSDARDTKRARLDIDDTKPQQSLADIYETDHVRATDSNYVDPKNQKLIRDRTEISTLWKDINSQLDTLSNWHYKPRTPQADINVVTDVATIMMEDAQPTTGSAVNSMATLAPHEIYVPGSDGRVSGELVLKNGASVSKDEMSREEKARLRRRQKKQNKADDSQPKQQSAKVAAKEQIMSDLKKADVKVIGKEGEVTDIHGKQTSSGRRNGADTLKL
ncbi:U3 small nucleolar ribonucleo protein Mpp10 [Aspergillus campestris IBT 28561]|uniref:U3 small nucleolar ribonucleoprotein protein MPP10 n=1 Tax=Aspergillus campestris (strain IBT 28561) TaxID=1392248 RepID=A0A2I1CW53_ASPC2|nr:U3 small nucleolar ribonucleo protein Mpp10 [Aspergillus campestris IBT 28561]PKY01844.1 U3 small nucleolar ribonucleo protein Mpp10 [Aspergillus campestris IBT 28561]